MIRSIIFFIVISLSSQAQAFSATDITGEWEWLGDSKGQSPNLDSAIKTNETRIILFKNKANPKVRYIAENNQSCSDCSGSYGLVSTTNGKPAFMYTGTWTLNADLIVIKRKAVTLANSASPTRSEAQRITYYKEKNIMALGPLVTAFGDGTFSYYKKRPASVTSISPYYSNIKDKFINNIDIAKIKLGMTPQSVITNIKDDFIINDVVRFSEANKLSPYVDNITAVKENDTQIDKYTFEFAKPPYTNQLLAIHRTIQFIFQDDMEKTPPTLKLTRTRLMKKYGKAKAVTETNRGINKKQKNVTISWFNLLRSCTVHFTPHSQNRPCPLLFDAQLSSYSKNHNKYPGIVNSLELRLINYPEIVQNEKITHQQNKMHEQPGMKMNHNKSLEFEL